MPANAPPTTSMHTPHSSSPPGNGATAAHQGQREGSPAPDPIVIADWKARLEATPEAIHALLDAAVAEAGPALADHFYDRLLADARAARFLTIEQVQQRLKPSLQRWLADLLSARVGDIDALWATQEHVGHVHARIGIPVDLVGRGARVVKQELYARLRALAPDADTALEATVTAGALLDIALESMTSAYARSREIAGQIDGSFRLFSLIQNVSTERERQRALLLGWENALLYTLTGEQAGDPQGLLLSRSEFGLWFLHKGLASFGDSAETREVTALTTRIDQLLLERLPHANDIAARRLLLDEVRELAGQIRSLVLVMFDGIGDLESGRDALTRLLNRRFLPTILRREIALQANTGRQFALLMLDLDHFKDINDPHGHEAGDRALQHVAALLVDNTRGSDYLFRFGGEEFVVVLGSVGRSESLVIAEALRRAIATSPLKLGEGHEVPLTASIGVALQDGHPDYERLLARADAAMYHAKRTSRDRVVEASDGLPVPPGAMLLGG